MAKEIRGICPIVAAAFTEQGEVDKDSFIHMVRHLLRTGASALTLFGLATEFYKLSDAEKRDMMKWLLAETSRSSDVAGVISITDHAKEVAVRRAQEAEAEGADAINILPPFFLGTNENVLLDHIGSVLRAVKIPVIVQYAPVQTNVTIEPSLFLRLKEEHENFRYVKVETTPPGPYVTRLNEGSGGKIKSLVGYAGVQMPDVLARGGVGIQPGCSFTEIYVEMYRLFQQGDVQGMNELHRRLLPYISYWMQGVELIIKAEKMILKKRGIIESDYCRPYSYNMDTFEKRNVDRFLEEFSAFF